MLATGAAIASETSCRFSQFRFWAVVYYNPSLVLSSNTQAIGHCANAPMAFSTFTEVENWAAENGGADFVEKAFARGDWNDDTSKRLVSEWLLLDEKRQAAAAKNSPEGLAKRVAEASERAAAASIESAKHAGSSARWAMYAAILAVTSLLITVMSK